MHDTVTQNNVSGVADAFLRLALCRFPLFQMDDIDAMFSHLLGEMDDLTNVSDGATHTETNWRGAFPSKRRVWCNQRLD